MILRETIALEKPGSFIPLLDAVLRPESYSWTEARDNLTESTNTEQIYQFVKEVALESQFLCGEGELASFETSLALHDALPRIEAMYQYYLDTHAAEMRCGGGSWVDWYGEVVCDVQTLRSLVEVEMIDPPESGETHSTRCVQYVVSSVQSWCAPTVYADENPNGSVLRSAVRLRPGRFR